MATDYTFWRKQRANRAPWNATGVQGPMIQSEPQPGIGLMVPDRAPGPRRAAAVAYIVLTSFVVQSEPHTQAREFPTRADGPRRTANTAYWLPFPKFVVPDEPEECQRPILPDRAPGPRRAANTAYHIAASFVVQSEPQTGTTALLPDRAPGPRRTANTAYELAGMTAALNAAIVPPMELLTGRSWPDIAPGARRAANVAYQVAASFVVQSEPAECQRPVLPDRAPGPRRTANTAYEIPPRLLALDFIEPERSEFRILWPHRAPGPRRAADYTILQPPPIPQNVVLRPRNFRNTGRPPNA